MWQIGECEDPRIFVESWVATKPKHKVECLNEGVPTPDLRINELIGPNGKWEKEIIRRSSVDTNVSLILNIKLRVEPRNDRMI